MRQQIDELNQNAWRIRISDSSRAFQIALEAEKLSRKDQYSKGLADSLTILGFGHIRSSNFSLAIACLDEALALYEMQNDLKGQAVVHEYIGIVQRSRGNSADALQSIFKALGLSRETSFTENETTNLYQVGVTYKHLANYDKALEYLFKSLALSRSINFPLMEAYNLNLIGSIYFETADYERALSYYQLGLPARKSAGDKWGEAGSLDNIGFTFLKLKKYDQAVENCRKSLEITKAIGDKKGQASSLIHLAEANEQLRNYDEAFHFCREGFEIRRTIGDKRGEAEAMLFLAHLYSLLESDETSDKKALLIRDALSIAKEINAIDILSKGHYMLYEHLKENKHFEEAIEQLEIHIKLEKELHRNSIDQKVINLEIANEAEKAQQEAAMIRLRNEELIELNKKIEMQRLELELTLNDLKSTQNQLIQSEKMASLGELTAGIAHEIQNPLNFVNNFSEVNRELLTEMQDEMRKGNLDEASAIANDVISNEEKINHHGKRADAIVKGMLQHSRSSSGQKEPTYINALCDEYLRLAYHGLRAKDKNFNARFETFLDRTVGGINLMPQEMGRVVLNLINNAFYAVSERKKSGEPGYEPTVVLSTRKTGNSVEISIKDNGTGIPKKIIEKIFQPFFTTKPTGQGTGLGLSLSYDIITKGHGGELHVQSQEGAGTEFIIKLPFAAGNP